MAVYNSFFANPNSNKQRVKADNSDQGQLSRSEFLQLSNSLNRITASEKPGSFLPELLQTAIQLVGGERGFLLHLNDDGNWTVKYAFRRDGFSFTVISGSISYSLLQRVIDAGRPFRDDHINTEENNTNSSSSQNCIVRSAICAPFKTGDQICGAIYVDSNVQQYRMNDRHLQLLQALTELTGVIRSHVSPLSKLSVKQETECQANLTPQLKQLFDSIIDSVPTPMMIINSSGDQILCNQAYQQHPVFNDPLLAESWQRICRSLETNDSVEYNPTEIDFAGKHYRLSAFPTADNCRGVIIYELAQSCDNNSLERPTVVSQLSGGIAHEIKNALAPAFGRLQLLENALKDYPAETLEKATKQIKIIHNQLNRIARIASSLSDLSRPQRLQIEQINLSDLVESTLELMGETAGQIKRFARTPYEDTAYFLLTHYTPDTPVISGDYDQLQQMLSNLLINAVHAVEEKNAGAICIEVHPLNATEVEIVIADTGIGIDKKLQDRIWEPWFSTKSRKRGSGLGMMIIKSIVELHRGHIWLDSWPGAGTKIHVVFPVSVN